MTLDEAIAALAVEGITVRRSGNTLTIERGGAVMASTMITTDADALVWLRREVRALFSFTNFAQRFGLARPIQRPPRSSRAVGGEAAWQPSPAILSATQPLLPSTMYGAVGLPFVIYFHHLVSLHEPRNFEVVTNPSVGEQFADRFEFTPAQAGTVTLTVSVVDENAVVLGSATTNILITDSTLLAATPKVVLGGDSTIESNGVATRVAALAQSNPLAPVLFGTRGAGAAKNEGRSGWTAELFLDWPGSAEADNPYRNGNGLWNSFHYCTDMIQTIPDIVVWHLGLNSISFALTDQEAVTTANSQIAALDRMIGLVADPAKIINSWNAANPNLYTIICLPLIGTVDIAAYISNYGLRDNSIRKYRHRRSMLVGAKTLLDRYAASAASRVYVLPWYCQIDPLGGYLRGPPYDAVHPTQSGYDQLGNSVYACIAAIEQERRQ